MRYLVGMVLLCIVFFIVTYAEVITGFLGFLVVAFTIYNIGRIIYDWIEYERLMPSSLIFNGIGALIGLWIIFS